MSKDKTKSTLAYASGVKVLAIVVTVLIAGYLIYMFTPLKSFITSTPNYAEEVAKPIEGELIKAGAVKMCENSDPGTGLDTLNPSYGARYQFPLANDETVQILQRIANENGYNLTEGESLYGSIHHYEDRSSKDSPYSQLKEGKVELLISTYSNTKEKELSCFNGPSLLGDESHTAVSLNLNLPQRR